MTRENAMAVAKEFLEWSNPTLWDGTGVLPQLDYRIWRDDDILAEDGLAIEIVFESADDSEKVVTYVDLCKGSASIAVSHCDTINSADDIADVIMKLYKSKVA